MRLISTASLAVAVSRAQGLGFIGAGTDLSTLESYLHDAHRSLLHSPIPGIDCTTTLPIGVGIITHAASLPQLITAITPSPDNKHRPPPAAIWLFAPHEPEDLKSWAEGIRNMPLQAGHKSPQVWVQAGSVDEALASALATQPEVLVLQGVDAGGHGLTRCASIVPLIPEVADELAALHAHGKLPHVPHIIAAGGISEGRGVAAALALGAVGVCLGTRFLASEEANLADGYRAEVVRAGDGGINTVRSRVYDTLRGTTHWPERFGGRGVTNASWQDWEKAGETGLQENKQRYGEAMKMGDAGWGPQGRMTTYAGTGVGLVKDVKPAGTIVEELRDDCRNICARMSEVST